MPGWAWFLTGLPVGAGVLYLLLAWWMSRPYW